MTGSWACQAINTGSRGGSGGYLVRVATPQDTFERSAHLAKQLRGFGLDARPYEKAPLELEIFAVTIEHRQIRPWAGTAMFQVVGDAKRRQAVLNVSEAGRQLTREYHVPRHLVRAAASSEQMATIVAHHFPVFVPGGRMAGFAVVGENRRLHATRVRATMEAPKSNTHLLMGYDEMRQFIAALPGRASTVEEAHALLRPSVGERALRQGEWFFEPAAPAELAAIRRARQRGAGPYSGRWSRGRPTERRLSW